MSLLELKTVDEMPPGTINEFIHTNKLLRRPPSLSESFAWTAENIERANQIPLLPIDEKQDTTEVSIDIQPTTSQIKYFKYEKQIVYISIKLLLHITLISIFETLFFFFYVSSLENNGIDKTVNTFIDGAANSCQNLAPLDITIIDDLLQPFLNSTQIISQGNTQERIRLEFDNNILSHAWAYVGALSGLFLIAVGYVKKRKIEIQWLKVISENTAMVALLAAYELMFFSTIIYPYQAVSPAEIARNAIQKLQNTCGILE